MASTKPATNGKPTDTAALKELVVEVLKKESGLLSTAEIHALLPDNGDIQQRQVYNLLYRGAAAGATFASVGEGKFTLLNQ